MSLGLKEQLSSLGYAIVPNFITGNSLQALREECQLLVGYIGEKDLPASEGDPHWAATVRGCVFETVDGQHACASTFCRLRRQQPLLPAVADLLFGPLMRQLVRDSLGVTGYLLNDQYIMKPPRSQRSEFTWHRDSDCMAVTDVERHPYISVWCALDDMTEENGCLKVGSLVNEGIAPHGSQDVHVLTVAAGTAVVMSDRLWHCSMPNQSARARSAWMPQFSSEPICYRVTGQPVSLAIPMAPEESLRELKSCGDS